MPGHNQPITFFHSIDVGGGEITPGFKSHTSLKQEADVVFSYPVKGKTFLDVGAWDGFFSFEAEARGASRVVATDWFCWDGPGWGTKAGFNYAREKRQSRVEDVQIDVPDISPATVGGIYDVVLLSGVLYHVTDPLSIIRSVAQVSGECLIVETGLGLIDVKEPAMLYLGAMDYNKDPTNFWAPNPPCVIAMLKACGFANVLMCEHPEFPFSNPTWPRGYFIATR